MSPARHGVPRTFAWPLVIAVASLIGLVGALLWDGVWDGAGALILCLATLAPMATALLPKK